MLTAALTAKPLDGITYDAGFAAATAAGVVATRVSNLVVTLDKIKYVMRQPGQNRAPFLRPLSDEEIVRHLLGEEGVLPRAADTFAKKVREGSTEPPAQMGLEFDTEVIAKVVDNIHTVKTTSAKSWVLMTGRVLKSIRDKRTGTYKIHPKSNVMFAKFKEFGVRIVAFTAANLIHTYSHECIGNIINSTGVKAT